MTDRVSVLPSTVSLRSSASPLLILSFGPGGGGEEGEEEGGGGRKIEKKKCKKLEQNEGACKRSAGEGGGR